MPSLCLRTGDSLTDNERDHQGFCLIASSDSRAALLLPMPERPKQKRDAQ